MIDGLRPYVDRAAVSCAADCGPESVVAVRDLIAAFDRAAGP